jgi:hypothetical protein
MVVVKRAAPETDRPASDDEQLAEPIKEDQPELCSLKQSEKLQQMAPIVRLRPLWCMNSAM